MQLTDLPKKKKLRIYLLFHHSFWKFLRHIIHFNKENAQECLEKKIVQRKIIRINKKLFYQQKWTYQNCVLHYLQCRHWDPQCAGFSNRSVSWKWKFCDKLSLQVEWSALAASPSQSCLSWISGCGQDANEQKWKSHLLAHSKFYLEN